MFLFRVVMVSWSHRTYNATVDQQNGDIKTVPDQGIINFQWEFH